MIWSERIAQAAGATVRWRPILLGALFKRIGTPEVPLFTMAAAKRAHPLSSLEALAKSALPPRGFVRAIREKHGTDGVDAKVVDVDVEIGGLNLATTAAANAGSQPDRDATTGVGGC